MGLGRGLRYSLRYTCQSCLHAPFRFLPFLGHSSWGFLRHKREALHCLLRKFAKSSIHMDCGPSSSAAPNFKSRALIGFTTSLCLSIRITSGLVRRNIKTRASIAITSASFSSRRFFNVKCSSGSLILAIRLPVSCIATSALV